MTSSNWGCRLLFVAAVFLPGAVNAESLNYAAPSELVGITREMRTAGFWIARHPYPDKLIMSPLEIDRFNAGTQADGLIEDGEKFPSQYDGVKIKAEIKATVHELRGRLLYQENGTVADEAFFAPLVENMSPAAIPAKVKVRYGFIALPADERLLPTNFPLYAKPGDIDFDELQNSGLDVGAAVMVLHSTQDGKWFYVKDEAAKGWVESSKVALAGPEEARGHLRRRDIVVVLEPKTDVFLDREMTNYLATVKMGTSFVMKNVSGRVAEVLIPQRKEDGAGGPFRSGFIAREDVNIGYLPYTPRSIIRQAFKMLNAPYGWGDMYGEQDCSRFVRMVFATVGLKMPRNSAEQGKVGRALAGSTETAPLAEKRKFVAANAVGGLAILHLKGHVMLYLGEYRDRLFAIGATWAYREAVPGKEERVRVLNRVAVTDLALGEGTSKGSFLQRILSVRSLEKE